MIVTNNDGTLTKMPIDGTRKISHNTHVHKTNFTSTSVKESRSREVTRSSGNR